MADYPTPSPTEAARAALSDLVSRYSANADYYRNPANNYNEHSCRDEYLNPLLRILGWDVENCRGVSPQLREVIAENYSSETERPDYSLNIRGVAKLFVEAKKPSVKIESAKDPAIQARKYGWNAAHSISVLTNFEYLVIYDTTIIPNADDQPHVARYRKFHFSEYLDRLDEIWAMLSRESVYSGYFDQYFTAELLSSDSEKNRVDKVFLRQVDEWRLMIAESLVKNNPVYGDQEKLNDAVQDLINQIVFLRICEDRSLPTQRLLSEVAADPSSTDERMHELLACTDRRYNSGLFKSNSALPFIDDGVLRKVITGLYYPQSPYMFDIIEPSLFGQIYEMFLSEQLIVNGQSEVAIAPKKEYVDRSVVATPVDVVRYIVELTLNPLCAGKTPNEIKSLKIADIACGSGIFLLEAFQYLMDYCVEWYFSNEPSRLIDVGSAGYKLPLEEKKELLTTCIYGIDIDAHAVEVAKLSLLIKLIEDEVEPTVAGSSPILPDLDTNIMLGNSLVDSSEASAVSASINELLAIVPFDWSSINGGMPFNAIIGNPPYVKTEDMHNLLTEAEFRVYKEKYFSAYKQFDKYFLFIERAVKYTTDGGYATFIVPNKFFKIASGKNLREYVSSSQLVVSIDDFGDAQLFEDKTIYSSIVCLQNKPHNTFEYAAMGSIDDLWRRSEETVVTMDSGLIGKDPWRLTTDIQFLKRLLNLEKNAAKLADHVEFFNGIQTSAERKRSYWFLHSEIDSETSTTITFERAGHLWPIERDVLRPFFKPTEEHGFNSYSILTCDKWLIFPYDLSGRLIPERTMKAKYPGAWAYLVSQKQDLWPKQLAGNGHRDVPGATNETWYQYGRTQALTSFNGTEKIIVGILSEEPLYYIDRNDWVIASGGTAGYCGIKMKATSPYCLEYIQAWLTNNNTEKIFEMIGSDFEGGFKSRGTSLLSTLPFVELDLGKEEQLRLYEEVVQRTKRIQEINAALSSGICNNCKRIIF